MYIISYFLFQKKNCCRVIMAEIKSKCCWKIHLVIPSLQNQMHQLKSYLIPINDLDLERCAFFFTCDIPLKAVTLLCYFTSKSLHSSACHMADTNAEILWCTLISFGRKVHVQYQHIASKTNEYQKPYFIIVDKLFLDHFHGVQTLGALLFNQDHLGVTSSTNHTQDVEVVHTHHLATVGRGGGLGNTRNTS